MTPPAALLDETDRDSTLTRPSKRQKTCAPRSNESNEVTEVTEATDPLQLAAVRKHPLGVRPSGNAFTADINLKAACGLYALLPDDLLATTLEYLEATDLLRLGGTCRALHAFTRSEELWKALFVEARLYRRRVYRSIYRQVAPTDLFRSSQRLSYVARSSPSSFSWTGTWRSTFLSQPQSREPQVDCHNLFSDVLHRPFFCAHVPLEPYVTNIPSRNQIQRLSSLTFDEFSESMTNKPFIISQPTKQWPVYKTWSVETLLKLYWDIEFRAEAVDWPLHVYVDYMKNNSDESPLYLFDRSFAEKMRIKVADSSEAHLYEGGASPMEERKTAYWAPSFFGPDLFSVLGEQRPNHRWLIVGPARSGSTFHKDPNATCAWNAVLTGRKYWIMFPSSPSIPPPPGVYVSEDQSEVTSPLSIAEWLMGFHAEARRAEGCVEGICEQGELLYVPAGWYHLVLNLEDSIALTQNFVPRQRLPSVLHFLRDRASQISGFAKDIANPFELFVSRLREQMPELLDEALLKLERLSTGPKGRWEELTRPQDSSEAGEGFSFGFGGGDYDDDDLEVP